MLDKIKIPKIPLPMRTLSLVIGIRLNVDSKSLSPKEKTDQPADQKLTNGKDKDFVIYSDELNSNWEDWSWDGRCYFKSSNFVHNGRYAISAELKGYGGLALGSHVGVNTKGCDRLEFFINGGESGEQKLKVFVNDKPWDGIRRSVSLKEGILRSREWKHVSISLADLDAVNINIHKVNISNISRDNASVFYVDDIMLISGSD